MVLLQKKDFMKYSNFAKMLGGRKLKLLKGFLNLKMSSTGVTGRRKVFELDLIDCMLISFSSMMSYFITKALVKELPPGKTLAIAGIANGRVITAFSIIRIADLNPIVKRLFNLKVFVFDYANRKFTRFYKVKNIGKLGTMTLAIEPLYRLWENKIVEFKEGFLAYYGMDFLTPKQYRLLQEMGVGDIISVYGSSEVGAAAFGLHEGMSAPYHILFPFTADFYVLRKNELLRVLDLEEGDVVEGELCAKPYFSWGRKLIRLGDMAKVYGVSDVDIGAAIIKLLGRKKHARKLKVLGYNFVAEVDYKWKLTDYGMVYSSKFPISGITSFAVINKDTGKVFIVSEREAEAPAEVIVSKEAVDSYYFDNDKPPTAVYVDSKTFEELREFLLDSSRKKR